jgi:hypothetical protein
MALATDADGCTLGRPKMALILTNDERVRFDSLAHRFRPPPAPGASFADHLACAEDVFAFYRQH